jgi:2'-5' RNA ligase
MSRQRLGVIARLPEPLGIHVQAWRRALGDPTADRIMPHLTIVPPQTVAERDLDRAVALVRRAAEQAVPFLVELDGADTFLPDSPVAYLVVREGGPALQALEVALQASPLDRRTHLFHPHVTVTQDLPADQIEAAARELAGFRASFPVREIALLREERDKVWRPLDAVPVGASTAIREVPFTEAASAALLLLDLDPPRVLLGLRTRDQGRRYPGAWDAIGGKPDPGESLLEALSREACEEAGVEPLDLTALGCYHYGERADAY